MFYRPLIVILALLAITLPVQAVTFIVRGSPTPVVVIIVDDAVGSIAGVDRVRFSVPPGNVGDGTPVIGSPRIRLILMARARPANSRLATVTADSSTPLSNGTSTIPFSEISWTASDADVPSGVFNDGIQTLTTFLNSRLIFSFHTFQYANSSVLQPGTYRGRVTYTITMP